MSSTRLERAVGYVVTKQLPEQGGELEFRIKRASEPHERVARESELAREEVLIPDRLRAIRAQRR